MVEGNDTWHVIIRREGDKLLGEVRDLSGPGVSNHTEGCSFECLDWMVRDLIVCVKDWPQERGPLLNVTYEFEHADWHVTVSEVNDVPTMWVLERLRDFPLESRDALSAYQEVRQKVAGLAGVTGEEATEALKIEIQFADHDGCFGTQTWDDEDDEREGEEAPEGAR